MSDVADAARRAGVDVRDGDVVSWCGAVALPRALKDEDKVLTFRSARLAFTVIPLMDAVELVLKGLDRDTTTYARHLFVDARRAALEVGARLHSARMANDPVSGLRLLGASECPGLADDIRAWIVAEVPMPPPAPVTKEGKSWWEKAQHEDDAGMVGSTKSNPRVPRWLAILVMMVWHETTKLRVGNEAPGLAIGVSESLFRLGSPTMRRTDSTVEILDKGDVVATMDPHELVNTYSDAELVEGVEDDSYLQDGALVPREVVEEVAFSRAAKAMAHGYVPMVVGELVRRSHHEWAAGNGDGGRIVYRRGITEMCERIGLKNNKAPEYVWNTLKLLKSINVRAHYTGGNVEVLGLLAATKFETRRGPASSLEIFLNAPLRRGYAASLKEQGISSQWVMPLQELDIDHERWSRVFGSRGIAGARRFNFGIATMFLPTAGSLAGDGSRVITDEELLAFADRCGFRSVLTKRDNLAKAKQLLVTPAAEGSGQMLVPGLAKAPLERVDGGAVTDEDGRYRLADPVARMQVLKNQRTSRQAKARRRRRR